MIQALWHTTLFRVMALIVTALALPACNNDDTSTANSAVTLSASSYTATQAGRSVTLTVARSGASNDTASVTYTTINGTATAGVEYTAMTGALTWAENDMTPKTIVVPLISTTPYSGDKTFAVELTDPSPSATIGVPGAAAIMIAGTYVPAIGTLQIADATYSATPGAQVTISVQRSGGDSGAVSVTYATANGTAVAGTNYTATTGTLDWADGDTAAKTISIPIAATPAFSGTKSLTVNLSGATGGAALGAQTSAAVTINGTAVPPAGSLQLSAANYAVAQGAGTLTVSVARTGGSNGPASVAYASGNGTAIAGTDYTSASGTLQWANGDAATKTFKISISNATPFSGNKSFSVALSANSGASISTPGAGTVTIAGDAVAPVGSLVLSAPRYTVAQNSGKSQVVVNRTDGSNTAISVAYNTANGTAIAGSDYTATSGSLQWSSGDTASKTFAVPISNAKPFSGSKTFMVQLGNPAAGSSLASPSQASVSIVGDAPVAVGNPQLSAATYSVIQSAGTATLTVNRTGGSSGAITVAYATANGTAVAGTNYTAVTGTLQWASGDAAAKVISIPISNAAPFSGTKSLNVALSSPSGTTLGSPASASVVITGDAAPAAPVAASSVELSAASYAATQTGGTVTVTVNRSAGTAAISVAYATANGTATSGTDYSATSGTLQWASGDSTAKTFSVPLSAAYPFSGPKTFSVALSDATDGATLGSPASATVTVTGDAAAAVGTLQLSSGSDSVAQSAGSVTLTVARSGGSNGEVSVAYATANGTAVSGTDYTATSGTLQWANGDATSKTFSVPVSNSTPFTGSKTFSATLSQPSAATLGSLNSATVSITGSSTGSSGSGGPSAVGNFWLVEQGGPNNISSPLTNYQMLSWSAASAGSNPISHYQIYRNGVAYATTTATSYADTNATNSNNPNWANPSTVYEYQVAAVDTAGNIGPQASQLSTWMYHDGVRYNYQDLSYGSVKSNYTSTAGDPQGGPYDISVYFNNGGFLPVLSAPQAPVDDLELGAFKYMTLQINPGNTVAFNGTPRIGILSRLPPGDVGPWKGANLLQYGPTPVPNTWNTYKIPLADLGIGFCTFSGSIRGNTMTVTSVQTGCVGIDGGGYVSGPDVPAGTYVLGFAQQASVGTFTLGGPGINGNTSVGSATMVYQRTAIYKFNITIPNEAPTWYFNNIGWTVN